VRSATIARKTNETDINVELQIPDDRGAARIVEIHTGVPFFDHMLHAMFYHGGFSCRITAVGDIEIDDHHTVEDTGIVIGQALRKIIVDHGPVARFGSARVPMDDSLGEAIVDASGRPFLVFQAEFAQGYAGRFDLALVREFFQGLTTHAAANIHLLVPYGLNGHHQAEALFKAAGRALGQAWAPSETVQSTKGVL
jgi:imidazoleglycerol-phosphate dehydratase